MDCHEVQQRLAAGQDPDGEAIRAHLDTCAPCRVLMGDGGRLATALSKGQAPAESADLSVLLAATRGRIGTERGARAWLRALPGPFRMGLAASAVLGVALAAWLLMGRADLHVYPAGRMGALLVGFGLLAGLAALWALRPVHKPPLAAPLSLGTLVLGFGLPVLAALLPQAHMDHPASLAGGGADWLRRAWPCFVYGLVTGLPVLLVALGLERRTRRTLGPILLAAAAAGLAGNLALQLHCPLTHPLHLLAGHASVGIAYFALLGGLGAFFSRRV